jgi:hypothetical protein
VQLSLPATISVATRAASCGDVAHCWASKTPRASLRITVRVGLVSWCRSGTGLASLHRAIIGSSPMVVWEVGASAFLRRVVRFGPLLEPPNHFPPL